MFLVLMALARGSSAASCRPAFLPTEDNGYLFVALQLPDAASLAAHERSGPRRRKEAV